MTRGPYQWGQNSSLYHNLARIKRLSLEILPDIAQARTKWINAPDLSGKEKHIIWTQDNDSNYMFIANMDLDTPANLSLVFPDNESWVQYFSTHRVLPGGVDWPFPSGAILPVAPGEAWVLKRV